jgi:hypothetical protein
MPGLHHFTDPAHWASQGAGIVFSAVLYDPLDGILIRDPFDGTLWLFPQN